MPPVTRVNISLVLAKYGEGVTTLIESYAEKYGQRLGGLPKKQLYLDIVAEAELNDAPLLNFNEGIAKEFAAIIGPFIHNHRVDNGMCSIH